MNEITRIRIAKVAYDIDIAAKKRLEKYVKSLESYTSDADVLADIEVRMTELLAERDVMAGGVISVDDVQAIREQLGEPYEFADEDGDMAVGGMAEYEGRKLFRDLDHAVLGGVLSGIAAYTRVNALWIRLVFIVVFLISFGLATFVYVVLWIIIPPARTVTDRLRQEGRSVTLSSLRQASELESAMAPNRVAPVVRRALSIMVGLVSLGGALLTFSLIIFGIVTMVNRGGATQWFGYVVGRGDLAFSSWAVSWLVLAGLLLLGALLSLISYMFFVQKFTRRLIMSGVVIIVLGLASLATTVGIITTDSWRVRNEAQRSLEQTKVTLPDTFLQVQSVKFELATDNPYASLPNIQYVVDTGVPRYELSGLPGAKPTVSVNGTVATVHLVIPEDARNSFVQTSFTLYGPVLGSLSVDMGSVSYTPTSQQELNIVTKHDAAVTTEGGSISNVSVNGTGSVDLGSTSVTALAVAADNEMNVTAGTVHTLALVLPDVCPSGDIPNTEVTVSGVTSGMMTYNGKKRPAKTYYTNCAGVTIGEDADSTYE